MIDQGCGDRGFRGSQRFGDARSHRLDIGAGRCAPRYQGRLKLDYYTGDNGRDIISGATDLAKQTGDYNAGNH